MAEPQNIDHALPPAEVLLAMPDDAFVALWCRHAGGPPSIMLPRPDMVRILAGDAATSPPPPPGEGAPGAPGHGG